MSESSGVPEIIGRNATAVRAAARRTAGQIEYTPLVRSASFSDDTGANVFFKLENQQTTGSYKFRGATNRLLTLDLDQRAKGCVVASSGNHGAAVACAICQASTWLLEKTGLPLIRNAINQGAHAVTAIADSLRDRPPASEHELDLIIVDGGSSDCEATEGSSGQYDSAMIVFDQTRTARADINEYSYRLRLSGIAGVGVVENFVG